LSTFGISRRRSITVAKPKKELLAEAQTAGLVSEEATEEDFTAEQLQGLVSGDIPVHERVSASKPIIAPDGHVVLSQEDIDARA
jgi:hypothetical protein